MQIVINIPKEEYIKICKNKYSKLPWTVLDSIADGVILPKGHGRLIDANKVKDNIGNLDGFGVIGRCIDEIPTVVEADNNNV